MTKETFNSPPSTTTTSGSERRVGYEFEFTGLEMSDAAGLIKNLYGGKIRQISTYEYVIQNTDLGTFSLELDARLLREKKYEQVLKSVGIDLSTFKNIQSIEDTLKGIASSFIPFEIITPPIPVSKMAVLNRLLEELRNWKAKGTGSSVFYAFGLHLNPEIPDDSVESLMNHLKAYILMDPWIRIDADTNISRRMTPYINEFKDDYKKLILDPGYQPTLKQAIIDYIKLGNTRNRPLDMLPVFKYLEEDLTTQLLKDEKTRARPAFHYRLPNCSIEDPDWTLANEWNRWVLVETLANDQKTLNQYAKAYLRMKERHPFRFETKWIELINRWIKNV